MEGWKIYGNKYVCLLIDIFLENCSLHRRVLICHYIAALKDI